MQKVPEPKFKLGQGVLIKRPIDGVISYAPVEKATYNPKREEWLYYIKGFSQLYETELLNLQKYLI